MKLGNFLSKYNSTKDFITNSWFLFLFPAALFYVIYFLLPIPLSFYYSFFKMSGLGDMVFIGLRNWVKIITDGIFWTSFQHNIILLIASLVVQIPLALGLAILIKSKLLKGRKIFKVSYFIPRLFSATAVGIIWQYIFNTNFGSLNTILSSICLGHLAQAWLSEFSLLSVFIVYCWNAIPFYMIIFIAALGNISNYLYE
ncbi:MAG: carbohydrate ABC transporter permease, partial [Halothermotrichaceae bacterium]